MIDAGRQDPPDTLQSSPPAPPERPSLLDHVIRFCLENKLVVALIVLAIVGWGLLVAPFDWELGGIRSDPKALPSLFRPVPTDAIPDIGENQQIVFTEWMGRSPRDVEDQISYPLTVSLLGIPGVRTIRSYSFFGFSSIYVIFEDDIEFYWSRSRVLEKLNSLPAGTLPEGVQPALGPDATALGQIYWYTLEGRDPDGNAVGGWDLQELRTVQDWNVRYSLQAAEGVSEVASVGGFIQEYQVDVDPDAMRAFNVGINDVYMAVRMSNIDVGARTIEVNKVEYVIRGIGFVKDVSDIEQSVVKVNENVPVYVRDVATVTLGPALRRGALDKGGAEAVGGVVVVRYGFNPLEAIKNVKDQIEKIARGLPIKPVVDYRATSPDVVEAFATQHGFSAYLGDELNESAWLNWLNATPRGQWPAWITTSRVTVVPFYDRTGLIYETLGTLNTALVEEILVTIMVVIISVLHLRSSLLISILLPLAVLMCFIAMRTFGVDANIVALSGIAIAIGTMVDMGIILCENILRHLDEAPPGESRLEVIYRASSEVGSAVLTAVSTTIVSFLPVFTMTAAEGKLFKPLAFTKTFALLSSVIVALTIIPPAAHMLFAGRLHSAKLQLIALWGLVAIGIAIALFGPWWAGVILIAVAGFELARPMLPQRISTLGPLAASAAAVLMVGIILTEHWEPLGPQHGVIRNFVFVAVLIGGLMLFFQLFQRVLYAPVLRWCLDHKLLFLTAPLLIVLLGATVWLGPAIVFGRIPEEFDQQKLPDEKRAQLSGLGRVKYQFAGLRARDWRGDIDQTSGWTKIKWHLARAWEGLGKEFMPPLDEGSFLYMPTTMPHASIGEALDVLQLQDKALMAIPEIDMAVGKLGRVDSPLDPAPISMIETIISYKPEFILDKDGHRVNFRYDEDRQEFPRDAQGKLIPDPGGRPYRLWRDQIRTPDDIWQEILEAAEIPGVTSAPRLQPIAARIVMLQSGMRAPMGVKVQGPDLETIERVALEIEGFLKQVPTVKASAVLADRVVGKPYLEIEIDRDAIARYGIMIRTVQDVIEVAIGGRRITTTVEGRERYPVRVRYLRELRDTPEQLGRILVPAPDGAQIPLEQLADIRYVRGPQVIKSEDTFLIAYVLFDMQRGEAEVNVVEDCQRFLDQKIASKEFALPPGVTYEFAGSYQNQVRSQKTLALVLPLALFIIFLILYFQFKQVLTTLLVFSGVLVAWAGGFLLIWLYGQPWFLDFDVFDTSMRTLFQVHPINLSVAIWVGFLALFGIATDDGVVIATYLNQSFRRKDIRTVRDARRATLEAGQRRVRPCLMTTATTILALLPVLTSTGRGSDIMMPMAIPSFGGMTIEIMTMFVVPVLYCMIKEAKLKLGVQDELFAKQDA